MVKATIADWKPNPRRGAMIAITAKLGILCPILAPPITGVASFLKPGRVTNIPRGTPMAMAIASAMSTISR